VYEQVVALRPDWHSPDVDTGKIKVVYAGDPNDADPIRRHVRRPSQNKAIQHRAKHDDDELELVSSGRCG
jgi:type I restriction enzyme R subunit